MNDTCIFLLYVKYFFLSRHNFHSQICRLRRLDYRTASPRGEVGPAAQGPKVRHCLRLCLQVVQGLAEAVPCTTIILKQDAQIARRSGRCGSCPRSPKRRACCTRCSGRPYRATKTNRGRGSQQCRGRRSRESPQQARRCCCRSSCW